VLEHEKGHYILNTVDEIKADEYSFNQFAGTEPGSLKNSLRTMNKIFSGKPAHVERMYQQYKRALKFDWEKNKNLKAFDELKRLETMENEITDQDGMNYYYQFTGIPMIAMATANLAGSVIKDSLGSNKNNSIIPGLTEDDFAKLNEIKLNKGKFSQSQIWQGEQKAKEDITKKESNKKRNWILAIAAIAFVAIVIVIIKKVL
jgi:hypothetical protein